MSIFELLNISCRKFRKESMLKRISVLSLSLLLAITGVLPVMPTFAHTQTEQAQTQEITALPLDKSLIERTISGGQQHTYSIDLAYDQFLFLDVQQLGIDVTVSLIDSDGKLRIETNAPDMAFGAEPFYWVAEKVGNYKIIIKPAEAVAKAGKYTIKISELKAANDEDFHFLDGQNKLAQGEKLRALGKKKDLEDAIACYRKAIEHWREVGQKEREGVCLNLMGFATYYLGDTQGAIEYIEQSAKIRPEGGGKAQSLHNAGVMYRLIGNKKKALEYFSGALQLSRQVGDKSTEANALNAIGNIYDSSGNQQEALSCYNEALIASREVGSRSDEAAALHNIGTIFSIFNDHDKAILFFTESLPIWDELGDFRNKIITLTQIGNTYMYDRELEKALKFYQMVVELATQKGQNREKGIALNQIGYVFYLKNDNQKALDYLQEALNIVVASKNRFAESSVLNRQGIVYSALGEQKKALESYTKSYEIATAIGDKKLEGDILYNKACSYEKLGDLASAVKETKIAIELSESARTQFSNQQLKTFYFATANNYYKLYVNLLMQLHEKEPTKGYDAQALYINELSQARTLVDLLQEGKINIREGINSELLDKEKELVQLVNKNTESLLRLVNKPNYSVEEKDKLEKQIHEVEVELEQVQGKIRQSNPGYAAIKTPKTLKLEEIQKEVLDDDTILLEYSLGKDTSYLWAVTNKSINSYKLPKREDIEKISNQVLVYYRTFFHPENESAEDKKQNNAKEQFLVNTANKFSQMLLGSIASQLGNKRLLIVADGILQYIPFAALPDPNKMSKEFYPLVVEHEVVTMPSASTMGVLRSQFAGRKPAKKSIMVLADPIFTAEDERLAINANKKQTLIANISNKTEQKNDINLATRGFERADLTRLASAGEEAKSIGQIYKDATIALGLDASLLAATSSDISNYSIIHFATHGFFNSLQPELSGLVLSLFDNQGKEQNGYLTANHIYNLRLNADLVVLSACQTGFGKEIKGEGILGLTRGFMYAGAQRVMFTIWSVNDQSTSVLMSKFYTAMKKDGLSPSAALRQAQIGMWKDKKWNLPYYWAAFQIQGEWQRK